LLENALKSLFSFEKKRDLFEVIVVNNDAREKKALQNLQKKFLFLLKTNSTNNGFGSANNRGVKEAKGDIIGFINPDTLWKKECLSDIEKIFSQRKDNGVLGMMLINEEGQEEIWGCGYAPTLLRLFWNNIFPSIQKKWEKRDMSFPDWVSGCGLFIRKDLFLSLNGFDEQFFLYFEDVDLCQRVREKGFLVARMQEIPLIHLGGQSAPSKKSQKNQFYLSQKKYYKKHRPMWENKILSILHFLFRMKTL